jgi:hypothetical protein
MSLHNGIDTVAIISGGVYTKNYSGLTFQNKQAIAALYASRGYFEYLPPLIRARIMGALMRFGYALTFQ